MASTFTVHVEFRKAEGKNTEYPYRVGFTVPSQIHFDKVDDTVQGSYHPHNSTHFEKTHQDWFAVKSIEACHDLFMKVEKVLISQSSPDLQVKLAQPEPTLLAQAQKALLQPGDKNTH